MIHERPLAVVTAWVDAVNARDPERVLQLSSPQVEIVGPRGTAEGYAPLREWMDHARVTLRTERAFARDDRVVLAQHGTWRSPETNEVMGDAGVASFFRVSDGRVARYARFDALDDALAAAGLDATDETPLPA